MIRDTWNRLATRNGWKAPYVINEDDDPLHAPPDAANLSAAVEVRLADRRVADHFRGAAKVISTPNRRPPR
jgi:hypothetical protein